MATRQVLCCDYCGKTEIETGTVLPMFFVPDGKDACFNCAGAELQRIYGVTVTAAVPVATNGTAPKGDGLTDKERARAKRREELQTEHGTVVYVVRRDDDVTAGQQVQHKAGDIVKNIEIIEGVHEEKGNYYAKVVI